MENRERYMVDVVNLPRLPLPELMRQLHDLSKLIQAGWSVALYDDVQKLCFLVMARSESGLSSRVAIPYEYMESIGSMAEREVLKDLWDKSDAAEKALTTCIIELLGKRSEQVKELQEAGVFDGKK